MLKDGWLRKAYHQMHPFAFDLASYLRGAKNRGTIRESITKSWVSASPSTPKSSHCLPRSVFAKITVKSAARDRRASARLSRSTLSGISKVETQAHALLAISSNGRTFCEVR